MSIADELRTGGIYRFPSNMRVFTEEELTAIADRIDAEHENPVVDALLNDGLPMSDDVMAEHGWYRALDGDKTPIRIGDEVDSDHHEDGTVTGVQFYAANGGIRTLVAVRPDRWDVATWYTPDEYHHHKPTVEDVLREFANECLTYATCVDDHEVTDAIELYAAKLRLASDAE